ncbi:MAG: type II toxin-antitoxin system RelE/ParE family toxin [Spiribacter salinus]|uniref:Type II toxin-antitoxin system RelE/ParE family toxin n=1 Tax=Spiribacter salinus TaxID=1335746 RepID=A0A540VP90_9GAMM|nr:MAG: type II toxin-antitoxin system RelE/ParE family toxin [Spiribacter salinus]
MYTLRYRKAALKGLRKLPAKQRQQMAEALQAIADGQTVQGLDIQPLKNRAGQRPRIGQWRAIYRFQEAELIVLVLEVGPRGDIYK